MITFRYHIVSLVSVFLALAIGIALGGGPLKGEVDNSLVKELAARKQVQQQQRELIRELRGANKFADDYAKATAPVVLDNALRGVPVALVALPGANQATVANLQDLTRTAGGRVVGSYRVGAKLTESDQKGLVDQLGTQMLAEASDLQVPDDASTYERFGLLLGRAIGTTSRLPQRFDPTSTAIISGLSTAGLVSAVGTPRARARVVLMVTGPGGTTDDEAAANEIHAVVADSVSQQASTVVLPGPASAARAGGLIRKVRDDVNLAADLSTADSAGSSPGAAVTILAAEDDLAGGTGQYGAVDAADGPVPATTAG